MAGITSNCQKMIVQIRYGGLEVVTYGDWRSLAKAALWNLPVEEIRKVGEEAAREMETMQAEEAAHDAQLEREGRF